MYKVSGKDINKKLVVSMAPTKAEAEKLRRAFAKAGIKAKVVKVSE